MSTDSTPIKRFKDINRKISFKVDSNGNGKFNIYQCPDGSTIWKLVKSNLTVEGVIKFQQAVVDETMGIYYNQMNFLKHIKNDKTKRK